MTKKELKEILDAEYKLFLERQEELRQNFQEKKQAVLDAYANENHRFNVGDILCFNNRYIEVTNFYGVYSNFTKDPFYVTYRGTELTKQLKPRKDGTITEFYDDGREITKIEKK